MMSLIFDEPEEADLDHLTRSDDPTIAGFARWLVEESGPDDWHLVAQGWNWDHGEDPLWWIVTRPNCDKATALEVFWTSNPYRYVGLPGWETIDGDEDELYQVIRTRWAGGFYTRSELAFDVATDHPSIDFAAYAARLGEAYDRVMPPDMRQVEGRLLENEDFIEGIPERFWVSDDEDEDEDRDAED
jgi:hypothetical protein